MDSALAGFAQQAWQLSNQSVVGMATTKGWTQQSRQHLFFILSKCGMPPPWHKFLYTRPYQAASAPCKAVSPLSKPQTSTWTAGKRWMKVPRTPPFLNRDSSSFSLWIAVQSGAVLWLVCVTHVSVSTVAALLHLDTHIKDCHFKGHPRAMQTSVASGRLGREGSRLERVCSVRECQVYVGSPGSSLLSVLLCLRLFSAPLPPAFLLQSRWLLL